MKSLSGKFIWITGASSGIGEALSKVLAKFGATIILSGRNQDKLLQVKKHLKKTKKKQADHLVVPFDICDAEQALQAYQAIKAYIKANHNKGKKIEGFDGVNWLINNAGISQRSLIMETDEAVERQIMEVDYFAQTRLTRLVLADMIKKGGGKVVMVSSIAGLLGTQYRGGYGAAKAAIHMWANSLRAELADKGIEVATVFPGFVQTNISLNALTADGSVQGTMDAATDTGLTADDFAQKVAKALIKGEEYIVVGGRKEVLGTLVNRLSPPKLYNLIRNSQVK